MKVTHFIRDQRPGNYSIEQIFNHIRVELSDEIDFDVFQAENPFDWKAILKVRKISSDVNHITGDAHYLSFGLAPEKTIITIHDIGHYIRDLKGLKKSIYRRFWLDGPLNRARKVISISEFTKKELIKYLGVPENKITVIPDPLLQGFEFSGKDWTKKKPVILQIGSGSNKNLSRLIEAVKGMDVKLLLINKLKDPSVRKQLNDFLIDYEQRVDLDIEGIKTAYKECDILFFASEYEGFGMPIIEAQATGRPVITSNITSMPEAAGINGAFFVNPFSIAEIRNAILILLNNEQIRLEFIENGLRNVKKYSLSKIANEYLKMYRSL